MNWNDPEERLRLIERVGPAEYNHLQKLEQERQTVETVNGHAIRKIGSVYGTLYMVDGLNRAYRTLAEARKLAKEAS